MDLYRDLIIELFRHPVNKRPMPDADITGSGANVTCGDRVRIYAKLGQDKNIRDLSFEGEGCAISMAASSLLTEEAQGKTLQEVAEWNSLNIFQWLGTELGPSRVKCGLLALETLQQAIQRHAGAARG